MNKFYGDYHTHTIYSHGKGTIMENAAKAQELGFREVAITDHGFRHLAYNARRRDVPQLQRDIKAAQDMFPDVRVYLGLETNITGRNGQIDIKPKDMEILDILLCGFHKFVMPTNIKSMFDFYLPVFWSDIVKKTSPERKVKNTEAYVNAIIKNDIDVITHINFSIVSDAAEVAKCAKEYGTFIELNGKHVDLSDAEIEKIAETGVKFIVNSDAHSVDRIGDWKEQDDLITRLGIPEEQIANLNKRPLFRSRIKRGIEKEEI